MMFPLLTALLQSEALVAAGPRTLRDRSRVQRPDTRSASLAPNYVPAAQTGAKHCGRIRAADTRLPLDRNLVFVELPTFHDRPDMAFRLGEKPDVLQRIAVDDQQIGSSALGDHAKFALHSQELRGRRRGRADDVDGALNARTQQELL